MSSWISQGWPRGLNGGTGVSHRQADGRGRERQSEVLSAKLWLLAQEPQPLKPDFGKASGCPVKDVDLPGHLRGLQVTGHSYAVCSHLWPPRMAERTTFWNNQWHLPSHPGTSTLVINSTTLFKHAQTNLVLLFHHPHIGCWHMYFGVALYVLVSLSLLLRVRELLSAFLQNKIQLGKFTLLIGFIQQFMKWTASHLVNRKQLQGTVQNGRLF